MTNRISWVKASASQSSRDRPSRCQGMIVCHLCASPSVRSADPRAGPSFFSELPGSWDPRKMSIMQECLAIVCLMCAHKSWKWPRRSVSLQFLHASPYYKGYPPQSGRREMVDGRNLCTGNLGDKQIRGSWPEVCLELCLHDTAGSLRLREISLGPRPLDFEW